MASLLDSLIFIPLVVLSVVNLIYWKTLPFELFITIISLIYKPFMEYKYGATLGKMVVKIKAVTEGGEPLTATHALVRYIPWLIGAGISIYSSVLLFQNEAFLSAGSWLEVGGAANNNMPKWVNYIDNVILIIVCIVVAFDDRRQGLHDKWAKTFCVYKEIHQPVEQ